MPQQKLDWRICFPPLKSDAYTKTGFLVPIIAALNDNFASDLYKKQYDALCFARDVKIFSASYMISLLINAIIGVVHGLFLQNNEAQKLYKVRTRKILLISNAIASSSTILNTYITQNPKNLDTGSLLAILMHLFTDIRFILKIKQEFIENEIYTRLKAEMDKIDEIIITFK